MNEKLKKYLDEKKDEELSLVNAEKKRKLIGLGLYDKVYSPDNKYSDEYHFEEWDKETSQTKYYKKAPIEITDEEFELLKKYSNSTAKELFNKENTISKILSAIAWITFIFGFIAGIVAGASTFEYSEIFSWSLAFTWWCSSFISGMIFLGFAEIINLLEDIKNK